VFGLDCDALFLEFERNWAQLKRGPRVHELVAKIKSHEYVEHVEKWTAVP
jgi:hypothetical protein